MTSNSQSVPSKACSPQTLLSFVHHPCLSIHLTMTVFVVDNSGSHLPLFHQFPLGKDHHPILSDGYLVGFHQSAVFHRPYLRVFRTFSPCTSQVRLPRPGVSSYSSSFRAFGPCPCPNFCFACDTPLQVCILCCAVQYSPLLLHHQGYFLTLGLPSTLSLTPLCLFLLRSSPSLLPPGWV